MILLTGASQPDDTVLVTLRPGSFTDELPADYDLGMLYGSHRLTLVRLAYLLVGDQATAEDVVQDAFAAVHRKWHALDDGSRALSYIRKTVVNRARSVLRRRRVTDALRPEPRNSALSAEDAVLLDQEHRRLLAAVRELAPRQKEILVLRYWSGLSEAEIAETMGISRGAVKSMAHRSLARLRQRLGE